MRVLAAIVVVSVALVAIAVAAIEYWPSESASPYTCATLDNGRDEVEVCISNESMYVDDCAQLVGRGTVVADPIRHQIVRDGHDRLCLEDIR